MCSMDILPVPTISTVFIIHPKSLPRAKSNMSAHAWRSTFLSLKLIRGSSSYYSTLFTWLKPLEVSKKVSGVASSLVVWRRESVTKRNDWVHVFSHPIDWHFLIFCRAPQIVPRSCTILEANRTTLTHSEEVITKLGPVGERWMKTIFKWIYIQIRYCVKNCDHECSAEPG